MQVEHPQIRDDLRHLVKISCGTHWNYDNISLFEGLSKLVDHIYNEHGLTVSMNLGYVAFKGDIKDGTKPTE